MDTHLLKAFMSVYSHSSFSHAALELHLTQPAISKRIATLESQLGAPLFDRIGRNLLLTEAGQILLPKAQMILDQLDETRRQISNLSDEVSGTLTLGTSHHIGLHRLPEILKQFVSTYPSVHLDIQFLDSEQAFQRVQQGTLDIAVITLPDSDNERAPNNLDIQVIWPDPMAFVVAKNHPLATVAKIDPEQLSQYPAILPGLNTYTGRVVSELFEKRSLRLELGMSTHYLETIKMMVRIGLGWSALPVSMLDEELIQLDLPGFKAKRELGYVVHRGRSQSNATRVFIELLNQNL
ncbi:MAG: LysR family transcriptional regulator [Pseudomonadales bacterium]|nr:LysR family transcriptional regulator [Pseudomonadales bacterium]